MQRPKSTNTRRSVGVLEPQCNPRSLGINKRNFSLPEEKEIKGLMTEENS